MSNVSESPTPSASPSEGPSLSPSASFGPGYIHVGINWDRIKFMIYRIKRFFKRRVK